MISSRSFIQQCAPASGRGLPATSSSSRTRYSFGCRPCPYTVQAWPFPSFHTNGVPLASSFSPDPIRHSAFPWHGQHSLGQLEWACANNFGISAALDRRSFRYRYEHGSVEENGLSHNGYGHEIGSVESKCGHPNGLMHGLMVFLKTSSKLFAG